MSGMNCDIYVLREPRNQGCRGVLTEVGRQLIAGEAILPTTNAQGRVFQMYG